MRRRFVVPRLCRGRDVEKAHAANIEIDGIEPASRRRAVRTGPVGPGGEQRMQRVDADEINTVGGKIGSEAAQIAEIADAPVVL